MGKFRKDTNVVEAVQWDGKLMSLEGIFAKSSCPEVGQDFASGELTIETLQGTMTAQKGDWIILGSDGQLFPCKPEIFAKEYNPA